MKYSARIFWKKNLNEPFADNKYSRAHKWSFDGNVEVSASSSPQVVAIPMSDESAIDSEEAFVASLSSCHMLFFLSIAAANHYIIESYEDNAEGVMDKNKEEKFAITNITLKPKIRFSGTNIPSNEQVKNLHRLAHEKCYIANSVKSEINIIPE